GHPQRRQCLRNPNILAIAKSARRNFPSNESDGTRIERARADERAIRGQGRGRLRPGSESTRVAHRSLRQQSNRCSAGETRCEGNGGRIIARTRFHQGNRTETFLSERSELSVSTLWRTRYFAGSGDEIDGRSDGHGC